MTTIIAVACAKGGCAKTTTTMQLAGILARWGYQTVVLDADNTGGATKWAMGASDTGDGLAFAVNPVNKATLNRQLIQRQHPNAWVFIDTPPSDTGTIQQAIDCADATIIPTQPSAMDLRLAGETYRATPNAVVLVTRAKLNTRLTKDTLAQLDEAGIARFENVVTDREAVKRMPGTNQLDMTEYSSVAQELIEFMKSLGVEDGE